MGGLPTEATLAHVLVSKYADHLPLYRQSQILARAGLDLHRAVLADWVGKAAFHLKPIVDRLAEHLKRSSKLFMDETTAPVLDPGRGETKTGYLWALARDDRPWGGEDPPGFVYFYAPGRAGENAETFLTGFDGILQINGYTGYSRLTKPARKGGALLGACPTQTQGSLRPRRVGYRGRRPAPHRRILCRRGRHPGRLARSTSIRTSGALRSAGVGLRRLAASATPQDLRQIPPGRKADLHP
jgi:hypothetical protein